MSLVNVSPLCRRHSTHLSALTPSLSLSKMPEMLAASLSVVSLLMKIHHTPD